MVIGVDQQVGLVLKLLAPPQHELAECRARIEEAFEIMAAAARADKYVGVTKRAKREYSAALKRLLVETRAYAAVGGALAIPLNVVKRAVDLDRKWSACWTPPPRWERQKYAVALAYELLSCWHPDAITRSRQGEWHQLAAILYGDVSANLYRQLRAFRC